MPDPKDRPGDRQVYHSADGGYYVEGSPGAGPRHHDDLAASPESAEALAQVPHTAGDSPADVAAETKSRLVWGPAAEQPDLGHALAIVGTHGLAALYYPEDTARAHEHAKVLGAIVAAVPVIADYRAQGGRRGD